MRLTLQSLRFGLASTCVGLAAAFVYTCTAPLPAFDPPVVQLAPRKAPTEIAPFMAPSQASFAAIDARPIFSPVRQPITPSPLPGNTSSGPPPVPDVALIGVILDSKTQLALVKGQGASFASSVGVGESVGGWEVTEVGPDHVTLRVGVFEHTLRMDDKRQAPPSQPAVTTPQPQAAFGTAPPNLRTGNSPQVQSTPSDNSDNRQPVWGHHGKPPE